MTGDRLRRHLEVPARRTAATLRAWILAGSVVAAWLALTVLFAVVGVTVVGTAARAIWRPEGVAYFLLSLGGVLGVAGTAPTLARAVLVAVAERADAADERTSDPAPDVRSTQACEASERCSRGTACCA